MCRIKNEGHSVGNHTFDHVNGWRTGVSEYLSNVSKCEEALPVSTHLFRPPYGRITRQQVRELSGYHIIMWDVLTWDFKSSLDADYCLRKSIKATRPGSIIVFHDSYKAEKNMTYILPRFIDHFSGLGYTFEKL